MLVDLAGNRCHALPFVDARLKNDGELEVIQKFSPLARLPQNVSELCEPWSLSCPQGIGSGLCKHCPPDLVVAFAVSFELGAGELKLGRTLGRVPCVDESCERRVVTDPLLTTGCSSKRRSTP
ncbi:MAG: hypothetical protein QM765_17605 [Myxococcales bacterium]